MTRLPAVLIVLLSFVPAAAIAADGPAAAAPRPAPDAYAFDIPPGPLDAAVARFAAVTGLTVLVPPGVTLGVFDSPGVTGLHAADMALEQLLAGTALRFRRIDAATYALDVAIAPERVEVTARLVPYRGDESASATRTATPLRDIPQTVTVVPRQLLVDQSAQSVADAVRNVPGVTVAQGEGNRDQLVLRGISTGSDFFVNGVRDDQERFRDLYNVQSVEVVQGPAAVLFGRGGAGGIVNLVTKTPVRGAPSEATADLGSDDHKRVTSQLEVGIGSKAALHLSAVGENSGGFRDAFYLHRYGLNPTVRIDMSGRTSLTVGYERLHDRRFADRGIPSQAGAPVDVAPAQLFGSAHQNEATSDVDSMSATFSHAWSPRVQLRNSVLVGRYGKFYQNVYPGGAVSGAGLLSLAAYNHGIDRTNLFNQTDLIVAAHLGGMTHTLLVGVEAGRQFQDEIRHTAAPIPGVPVASAIRDADFAAAPLTVDRHATSSVLAAYAQDQIAFSPHWKAVAGARIDRFAVAVADHLPGAPDLSRADAPTSPRVGVIYQPTAAASLYTSYSYTFLPSGQTLGLAVNTAGLEPESASNYEAGAKLGLAGGRVGLTTALFRLDRNHVKNTDPTDPTRLVLTGRQRTDGYSVAVAGHPAPRWTLYGGYAGLNARIVADTAAAPAGRRVGLVPRSQLTLWSTYDFSRRWGAGGGVLGQSRMFTSFSNAVELPGFFRLDGVVSYRRARYRLSLNAENLLNSKYYPTANGDNNISPGSPRSVRVTLTAFF